MWRLFFPLCLFRPGSQFAQNIVECVTGVLLDMISTSFICPFFHCILIWKLATAHGFGIVVCPMVFRFSALLTYLSASWVKQSSSIHDLCDNAGYWHSAF